MDLFARFLRNAGRTIHKLDHYFPIYERHFNRFVRTAPLVVEIGCGFGGSLQMWRDYFGAGARIVGVDVRQECLSFAEEQIDIRIGDQADAAFLQSLVEEFGTPSIIIDDGSHLGPDQRASFEFLYPRVSPTGVYLVEDLHCAYLPQFDGGVQREGTFIEDSLKPAIDQINALWWDNYLLSSGLARTTASIHVYDSVAVFERSPQPPGRNSRRVPHPPAGEQISWPRHR